MDSISPTAFANAATGDVLGVNPAINELKTEDFFQLLINQLSQQDPFEPVKNQDLLNQIGSIRDMEANAKMNETLERLASQGEDTAKVNLLLNETLTSLGLQSDMATGASLIGRHVTATAYATDEAGNAVATTVSGKVVGVKLVDGKVRLELDTPDKDLVALSDITKVSMTAIGDDTDAPMSTNG
ncbi:MAG: flagellar hook capping FlgD N-terminal domain-containing protein [Planctomycetota bacterium]